MLQPWDIKQFCNGSQQKKYAKLFNISFNNKSLTKGKNALICYLDNLLLHGQGLHHFPCTVNMYVDCRVFM